MTFQISILEDAKIIPLGGAACPMAVKRTKPHVRTYTASKARSHFSKILHAVEEGDEVVITKHGVAVAMIMRPRKDKKHAIPAPGFLRDEGWSVQMSEDFDRIPEGFEDYVDDAH